MALFLSRGWGCLSWEVILSVALIGEQCVFRVEKRGERSGRAVMGEWRVRDGIVFLRPGLFGGVGRGFSRRWEQRGLQEKRAPPFPLPSTLARPPRPPGTSPLSPLSKAPVYLPRS